MDQYVGSPGHSTCCDAELTASFINFLHYCSASSGFHGAGKDNRGRCIDNLSDCHPIGTVCPPTAIIHPFLRRMPFLPQCSRFILAWDRHQIMLACISSGLVVLWLWHNVKLHNNTKLTNVQIKKKAAVQSSDWLAWHYCAILLCSVCLLYVV